MGVEVELQGDFGAEGEPAQNVTYQAKVRGKANEADIWTLMQHTDQVAEIQNSLRVVMPVRLSQIDVQTV